MWVCSACWLGFFIWGLLAWSWYHFGGSNMSKCHWKYNFPIKLLSSLLRVRGLESGVWHVSSSEYGIFPSLSTIMQWVTSLPHTFLFVSHLLRPKFLCDSTGSIVSLLSYISHCHFLHHRVIVTAFYGLAAFQNIYKIFYTWQFLPISFLL